MAAIKYFFEGFKTGTVDFSKNIGIFLNLVLLTAVYFLGVGLVFLIVKISGKKFLRFNFNKKAKTYWEERDEAGQIKETFYRQF
jgi:hypothetical protein